MQEKIIRIFVRGLYAVVQSVIFLLRHNPMWTAEIQILCAHFRLEPRQAMAHFLLMEKPTVVAGPSPDGQIGAAKFHGRIWLRKTLISASLQTWQGTLSAEMANIKQFTFSLNPLYAFESPVLSLLRGAEGKSLDLTINPNSKSLRVLLAQSACRCSAASCSRRASKRSTRGYWQ